MSTRAAVAILGGSSAFTPVFADALAARARELPRLDVRLHGRDAARLASVAAFANRLARARGADQHYSWTLAASEAAHGARVVVNQVRAGGFAGREHDERFPLEHGLPGDETIGPGGLASALRSTDLVLSLARASVAVAPDAWFVNLTNPMDVLLGALQRVDGLSAFGLCELPGETLGAALRLPGVDAPERGPLEADYVGLNHQGWFVRVERAKKDLLPAIFDAVARRSESGPFRVDADVMRSLGALPLPYLRLFYHREREVTALRARPLSRGAELAQLSAELHEHYATSRTAELPALARRRATPWIERALVPALVALLGGPPCEAYVSTRNERWIPELDRDVVVEKRWRIDARGPAPGAGALRASARPVPATIAPLLARLAEYQSRALAASLDPSDARVLDALRALPFDISGDASGGVSAATARALLPAVRRAVETTESRAREEALP